MVVFDMVTDFCQLFTLVPLYSPNACALISFVATQNLSISGSEVACRFSADLSAISRATLRVSRNPKLPAATKTIQKEREFEPNQH